MELGAWVEDFKLTPYAKDVERYAIVSDSNLFDWTAKIGEAFIGGEVKRFEDSRYEEARRWLGLTSSLLPRAVRGSLSTPTS
jgi:hypothetical protein